ncbi:MAG: helix-turn-helix transcriptional regulator [Deltaproteobacteria bacterium]|nr:helix-turn-helix transcriptional regulator [Deltaproteobacteria bacterium]
MAHLEPKEVLARNLRRIRTSTGLSQEGLAARSGLHRTYISSVERGQRNVSVENIFAIARALGCDPQALIDARSAEGDG